MSYYDPDGWGTPLIVIVLGLSLITFPFYVRVRVHMRMSDEAFAQVPRGALWAQSIGIWNLVFLGLILLIFVQDHPDSERYATMSLILGIVILHLMARLMHQTYPSYEVIVSDSKSKDHTREPEKPPS